MPFLPPNCMVHDCLYISQLATISGGRSPIHHLGTRLVACSKAPFIGEYNTCSVRTCQLQLRISMTTYFWKCSHCTLKTKKNDVLQVRWTEAKLLTLGFYVSKIIEIGSFFPDLVFVQYKDVFLCYEHFDSVWYLFDNVCTDIRRTPRIQFT